MSKSMPDFSARELTPEEIELFETTNESLQQVIKIGKDQYDLSKKDREYLGRIFRGEADANDPVVKKAIADAIEEAKESGKVTTADDFETWKTNYYEERQFQADLEADITGGTAKASSVSDEELHTKYTAYKTAMSIYQDIDEDEIRDEVLDSFRDDSKSVDKMLMDAIAGATGENGKLATALGTYTSTLESLSDNLKTDLSGLSSKYKDNLLNLKSTFERNMEKVAKEFKSDAKNALNTYGSETKSLIEKYDKYAMGEQAKMGQADRDILSRTRGQQLAGISQAYQESQKQLLASLGSRGLAGSGVEAGALSQLSQGEALSKSGALNRSYLEAVGMSDARRQMGIGIQQGVTNQMLGTEQAKLGGRIDAARGSASIAGQAYSTGYQAGVSAEGFAYQADTASTMQKYSTDVNTAGVKYNAETAAVQQNIANLAMASGISQGVYTGSQNYLAQAGTSAANAANTASTTAIGIGNQNVNLYGAQLDYSSNAQSGIYQMLGTGVGSYTALKTN